jgi:teichoic acid transport system permease protein
VTQTADGRSRVPRTTAEAAALAARHGLARVDQTPGFGTYLGQLWSRREFVVELARAKAYSRNENTYLGQLWATLNPRFLAGAYFLIFGLLLRTSEGTDNYIGFLTIGIFVFSFIAASTTSGARAITGNQSLVRAIRFPRAALPISVALSEVLVLLPALGVLLVLLPFTGERPRWTWALLPVAVVLLFAFCTGVAMLAARLVAATRDALNLVPLGVRLARYVSGVFFSIETYAGDGWVGAVLQYQPVAVYLDLVRSCLLAEAPQRAVLWWAAVGWAVLLLLVGAVLFWRAEQRYGRD